MRDAQLAALAGRQFNRISRQQLRALGLTKHAIDERVLRGRLVITEQGVFALAPVLEHDPWGRRMGATLTAPQTFLSLWSAGAAWGLWGLSRGYETVTRPGKGGPRRHGGLLVFRSSTLEGETSELHGIPITSVERTLLDLAPRISERALGRAVREAVRLKTTRIEAIADFLGCRRNRRGAVKLARKLASYTGLPIERARSGAEVTAMQVLRDASIELPRLNVEVAGEEADLSWPGRRLIIEIDGGPFHQDLGEDARKEAVWEAAGWTVRRLPSDDVADRPERLLALAAG